ncbi:MAG: PspC domain-containing protein [Aestuariibacter sp.]
MREYYDSKKLFKDSHHSKISGVCAGLAKHWNMQIWIIRVLAVAGFLMFPVAFVVAYLAGALLLPSR